MIVVDFHAPNELEQDHVVATLTVRDDLSWSIEGDPDRVPLDVGLVAPTATVSHFDRVTFETDPVRWCRLLPRGYGNARLVAVVREDTSPVAEEAEPAAGDRNGRSLTRSQAAKLAGVKVDTWSSYVARGHAPAPIEHVGRTPLWDADQLRAWLRTRK